MTEDAPNPAATKVAIQLSILDLAILIPLALFAPHDVAGKLVLCPIYAPPEGATLNLLVFTIALSIQLAFCGAVSFLVVRRVSKQTTTMHHTTRKL